MKNKLLQPSSDLNFIGLLILPEFKMPNLNERALVSGCEEEKED